MTAPRIRALAGALLIGVGIALFVSAIQEQARCIDCEESAEATAEDVATASAEMTEPVDD